MASSERLTRKLVTCSLTPRSGRAWAEEMACTPGSDPRDQVYAEAKLALVSFDFETAELLFARCDPDYRSVRTYRAQCALYRQLCETGVLRRDTTEPLRRVLAEVLGARTDAIGVTRTAELLHGQGHTAETVRALTLWDADRVLSTLPDGARRVLETYCHRNSGPLERVSHALARAVAACGGWERCAERLARQAAPRSRAPRARDDDETGE